MPESPKYEQTYEEFRLKVEQDMYGTSDDQNIALGAPTKRIEEVYFTPRKQKRLKTEEIPH